MDTKRLVIAMTLAMAVVFGWQMLLNHLYPPVNRAPTAATTTTTQPGAPATLPAGTAAATSPATLPDVESPAAMTAAPGSLRVASVAETAKPVTLGSPVQGDSQFAMAVNLTAHGAGIESVTLNDFRQVREKDDRYTYQRPYPAAPQTTRPLATRTIMVDHQALDLTDVAWQLEGSDADSATYFIDIVTAADDPVLRVRKTFTLTPRSADPTTPQGYEVHVNYSFENRSGRPLPVQTNFNGPTTPPQEIERGHDREIVLGNLSDGELTLAHHFVEEYQKDKIVQQLIKSDQPMQWAGTSGAYFAALVMPRPLGGGAGVGDYIEQLNTEALNPGAAIEDRQVAMVFQTRTFTVDPGATATLPLEVFFGPKSRAVLKDAYYAAAPKNYDQAIIVGGGCTICTFQWLIDGLVGLLNFFHMVFRDWGMAIICLVVLVRLILHPITKRSTINMAKMGKMGPEMERLKKKYGDDKDELNRAMMQLYKEQGFTPILGCLPMFLQMPIWIALWTSLQSTFELRQEPFFYGLTWIDDLARPDRLIEFPAVTIPLIFTTAKVSAFNLLPVLLGVVFFLQQKYTPKPAAATKEQEQQQKMMQWMSLLFPLFLYNGPSGLNIYILTSTTIGIIEAKRIRDHIKEREEVEKAGKVIIDAKPTRGHKRGGGGGDDRERGISAKPGGPKGPDRPRGRLAAFLADLQQRVDEMQRNAKKPRE